MNELKDYWNRISDHIKKSEEAFRRMNNAVSCKAGRLEWKENNGKFRIVLNGKPLMEHPIGTRVAELPNLLDLEKAIEKKSESLLKAAEKSLFKYNEDRGNK